jgi:alpha-galactosidase
VTIILTLPASAGTFDRLVGTWLIVPSSVPGSIPATVEFYRHDNQQKIIWMIGPRILPASEIIEIADGQISASFSFDESDLQDRTSFELAPGNGSLTFSITSWSGKETDIKTTKTGTARRVSRQELAAIEKGSPHVTKDKILPLPHLHDIPSNGLAMTPPMGWSSWNAFRVTVSDKSMREMADALVATGLRDMGYVYVIIDEGWAGARDARGVLHANSKFPDIKSLADYIHSKGLKVGIATSPGPITCNGYLGSHGYETQDAATFAQWGIDYVKHDWCSAENIYRTQPEMQGLYQKMGAALQATGRPIVYSLCQYGLFDVGSWGRKVGGNLWRTGDDTIQGARWTAITINGFESNGEAENAGPGGWNDPDMMLVGIDGLNQEEYRTHMTLWAISAAPLILGNDLRRLSAAEKDIVMNKEVIAVDQDVLGIQGRRILQHGAADIWTKPLLDGATAVALFNRGEIETEISVKWGDIKLNGALAVRNLWQHADLGTHTEGFGAMVPRHGSVLLRVAPVAQH